MRDISTSLSEEGICTEIRQGLLKVDRAPSGVPLSFLQPSSVSQLTKYAMIPSALDSRGKYTASQEVPYVGV
jgi:hypothetical protein